MTQSHTNCHGYYRASSPSDVTIGYFFSPGLRVTYLFVWRSEWVGHIRVTMELCLWLGLEPVFPRLPHHIMSTFLYWDDKGLEGGSIDAWKLCSFAIWQGLSYSLQNYCKKDIVYVSLPWKLRATLLRQYHQIAAVSGTGMCNCFSWYYCGYHGLGDQSSRSSV